MRRCFGLPALAVCFTFWGGAGRAGEVDPKTLYTLSTDGSSTRLKAGGSGHFVLTLHTVASAHISDEAPMKLELSSTPGLSLGKRTLTRKDAGGEKEPGRAYATPRFDVPFTATAGGPNAVDAKVTFFVCTASLCLRQQQALKVPVSVSP